MPKKKGQKKGQRTTGANPDPGSQQSGRGTAQDGQNDQAPRLPEQQHEQAPGPPEQKHETAAISSTSEFPDLPSAGQGKTVPSTPMGKSAATVSSGPPGLPSSKQDPYPKKAAGAKTGEKKGMSKGGRGGDSAKTMGGAKPKQMQEAMSSLSLSEKSSSQGIVEKYRIPAKPDIGDQRKEGRPIQLLANHFEVKLKLATVYLYVIEFTCNRWRHGPKAGDRPLMIKAFEKIKRQHEDVFPGKFSVFDGNSRVISADKLRLRDRESFTGTVDIEEYEGVPHQILTLNFTLTFKSEVNTKTAVEEYCQNGRTATRPIVVIDIINVILAYSSRLTKITIGRSIFNPREKGSVRQIGPDGKVMWTGIFSSFRPGWKPFMVVDLANKPAYAEQETIEYVAQQLGLKANSLNVTLNRYQVAKIATGLSQLKIRFLRPDGQVRDFRVQSGLGPTGDDPKAVNNDGKKMSVQQYFRNTYKYEMRFPKLPTLHVGNKKKNIFIPMELTKIKEQGAPIMKRLSEKETSEMIRFTAVSPEQRIREIERKLHTLKDQCFRNDEFAKRFQVSIADNMTTLKGRVLDPPMLSYTDWEARPRDGKWRMGQKAAFTTSKALTSWTILYCSKLTEGIVWKLAEGLKDEGRKVGIRCAKPVVSHVNEDNVEDVKKKFHASANANPRPVLIIVICEMKRAQLRNHIKYLGDVVYKIPTQFVMKAVVDKVNGQILHNILLKINTKLGGTNQLIAPMSRPPVLQEPVMLLGADVTHPSSDTPREKRVSIAAMVASVDPNAQSYSVEISLQTGGQVQEMIEDTQAMVKRLLIKFRNTTRYEPRRIIYYRDGVSESQFQEALNRELHAMREACTSLNANFKPKITFLVAQKRHKTRLFPADPAKDGVGRMKNVPPGTIADEVIVHPTEESFYLASHEGIQGTTKPTHYHKLWDDSNFSSAEIQKLTFYLCHLYTRCERSVSLPAPTYYAHLAAFRAREHLGAILDKNDYNYENSLKEAKQQLQTMELINFFM